MSNELFRRLQMSSPKLAKEIALNQKAMEAIRRMENLRIATEYAKILKHDFPFITIKNSNEES